jgi:translation initiation factor 1 (eIF-1/SUI1)
MQQASRLTLACLCFSDAFADAAEQEEDTSGVDYVHIRIQQRNGKKSLTTVQVDL